MATVPYFTVDSFTTQPFSGNPAGVCLCDEALTEQQQQLIAREIGHSETGFLVPIDAEKGIYSLRWFTPKVEVDLCGHCTLAAAHVLFHEKKVSCPLLTFKTKSGDLLVHTSDDKYLHMNFPQNFCSSIQAQFTKEITDELCAALSLSSDDIKDIHHGKTTGKLIVEMKNFKSVLNAKPNPDNLMKVPFPVTVKGVVVTTSNLLNSEIDVKGYDCATRYFAPWVGIAEDPVNGINLK